MKTSPNATGRCGVCGRDLPRRRLIACSMVRPQLAAELDRAHPDWQQSGWICNDDLAAARRHQIENLLVGERGELTALDRSVLDSMTNNETLSRNIEDSLSDQRSFGDRVADKVAQFGGSWAFIISFSGVLVLWMAFNVLVATIWQFDPYPFILLNLVLSSLAAFQAPIIMMSQRRQEQKDRARSENDYQVNLKAELEIRHLHEKIDHLLMRQWERLTEIQQIQLELMEDIADGRKR